MSQTIHEILVDEFIFYGAQVTEQRIEQYAEALGGISDEWLKKAILTFRRRPGQKFMPTPGDYLSVIPDGRPTASEAWALIPHGNDREERSFCWTEEMRIASNVAKEAERQGENGFFAFQKRYDDLLSEARSAKQMAEWSMCLGHDHSLREGALLDAISENKLTLEYALAKLPEIEFNPRYERLMTARGIQAPRISHEGVKQIENLKLAIGIKKLEASKV